jgi:hypothetical protein
MCLLDLDFFARCEKIIREALFGCGYAAMYYYPSVSFRAAKIHRDIVGCGLCSDVGQVGNHYCPN